MRPYERRQNRWCPRPRLDCRHGCRHGCRLEPMRLLARMPPASRNLPRSRTLGWPDSRESRSSTRIADAALAAASPRRVPSQWRAAELGSDRCSPRVGPVGSVPSRRIGRPPRCTGCRAVDEDLVEITCPRWRRARHDGLIAHETKALSPIDLDGRLRDRGDDAGPDVVRSRRCLSSRTGRARAGERVATRTRST